MLQLMNQLTDKPDWQKKVFDETIVSKWKAEALSSEGAGVSEKMIDWCIAELQYKTKAFEKTGAVTVYSGDVVKSDIAIPNSLKEALKAAASPLEQVPAVQKDWHPESDEKVLDLVHPSLFPLVYGQTRILPDSLVGLEDCIQRSGEGQAIPVPPEEESYLRWRTEITAYDRARTKPFSIQFQWLPCDVDISGGGDSVKITSYINNLHPERHRDMYGVIEQIIARTIPLWNLSLTPVKVGDDPPSRIEYGCPEYDKILDDLSDSEGPEQEDDEDEDEWRERREEWFADIRELIQPEPGVFSPSSLPVHLQGESVVEGTEALEPEKTVDIWRDYKERGLQIIVKLANIHLTPQKPEYEGGTWHVEGQLNEHICASAIYYYDSDNITTSRLAFRQQSNDDADDISYAQGDHEWLEEVFGCEQAGPRVQEIGSVDTIEGRLLTWPNVLQHQVQPFSLADPSKPGHRKVLALFLVDPQIRIISTANVPCQQREWWSEFIQKEDTTKLSRLPLEVQDHIFDGVEDFPIDLIKAKELRLDLMKERSAYVKQHDDAFSQFFFSLCEH
ncbi:hypothetical protein FPV67DRAFT_317375 [Lyophyllum atratum]|nr:hypothetical protein FPV67DRAFT_317375 [Lyophyllum atratum]